MRFLVFLVFSAIPAAASPTAPPPMLPDLPIIGPAEPRPATCGTVICERTA
jgi:hypothetical protein